MARRAALPEVLPVAGPLTDRLRVRVLRAPQATVQSPLAVHVIMPRVAVVGPAMEGVIPIVMRAHAIIPEEAEATEAGALAKTVARPVHAVVQAATRRQQHPPIRWSATPERNASQRYSPAPV